jgi:hypothetical protein
MIRLHLDGQRLNFQVGSICGNGLIIDNSGRFNINLRRHIEFAFLLRILASENKGQNRYNHRVDYRIPLASFHFLPPVLIDLEIKKAHMGKSPQYAELLILLVMKVC